MQPIIPSKHPSKISPGGPPAWRHWLTIALTVALLTGLPSLSLAAPRANDGATNTLTPTNMPEVTKTPTKMPEMTRTPTNIPEVTNSPTKMPEATRTPPTVAPCSDINDTDVDPPNEPDSDACTATPTKVPEVTRTATPTSTHAASEATRTPTAVPTGTPTEPTKNTPTPTASNENPQTSTPTPTSSNTAPDTATPTPSSSNSVPVTAPPTQTEQVTAVADEAALYLVAVRGGPGPRPEAVASSAARLPRSGGVPFPAGGLAMVGLGIAGIGLLFRGRR